jgi:hypothetical protein
MYMLMMIMDLDFLVEDYLDLSYLKTKQKRKYYYLSLKITEKSVKGIHYIEFILKKQARRKWNDRIFANKYSGIHA